MTDEALTRRSLLGLTAAGLTTGCLRLSQESDQEAPSGDESDSSGQPSQDSPDGTESDQQVESTDTGGIDYPTGVSEDGVTSQLLLEHRARISGEPVTVTETESREFDDRTVRRRIGDDGVHVVESVAGNTIEQWFGGGEKLARAAFSSETVYAHVPGEEIDYQFFTATDRIGGFLKTGNFRPTGTATEDGTTYVALEADDTESNELAMQRGADQVTAFEGAALVSEDGLVRRIQVSFTVTGDREESARVEIETTDVGETTVSEPDWTATAAERAPKFDVTPVDDGKFLELTHTGGDGIPLETAVGMFQPTPDGGQYHGIIEGGIPSGTKGYLYKKAPGELGISPGSRPDEDPEPFSGRWEFDVFVRSLEVHQESLDF